MKYNVGDLVAVGNRPCIYRIIKIKGSKCDVECIINSIGNIVKDPHIYTNTKAMYIDISLEQYLFCLKNNLFEKNNENI